MSGCDRCGVDRTFLFTCRECGRRFCEAHRAPVDHLCITFPPLDAGDGAAGSRGAPAAPIGRALRVIPAVGWVLAVLLVEQRGLVLDPVGTLALVAFGSVALWLAAASVPRVESWLHADE